MQGTQSGVWCLDLIRYFLEDKLINVFSLILIASQILNKQFVRVLFICYQSFTDLDPAAGGVQQSTNQTQYSSNVFNSNKSFAFESLHYRSYRDIQYANRPAGASAVSCLTALPRYPAETRCGDWCVPGGSTLGECQV